jgi:hypothetical protein
MFRWVVPAVSAFLSVVSLTAQTAQQALPVEMALPFGVANGKVVLSGDYLMFVNDTAVENSFVVPRDNVQNMSLDGAVMTVALRKPIRDAGGDKSTVTFRFAAAATADPVVRWSKATGGGARPANEVAKSADRQTEGQQFSYDVKHEHRVGSCNGRLIVTGERVIYESLSDINDSRQWSMKDIKEVGHKNPYKLDIKPFMGNEYSFSFVGSGMDNGDYDKLTKLISGARAPRQ